MKDTNRSARAVIETPTSVATSRNDLQHFLKLAAAQVRHRMKSANGDEIRSLQLLEDLIQEQGQANENSHLPAGATR